MTVILTGTGWYLTLVLLMGISLMISEVGHLFMYLLAIWDIFFKKNVYLSPLPIFKSDCLVFWNLVVWAPYSFWTPSRWFANIFSYSIDLLFILLIVSFAMQKALIWFNPIFAAIACAFSVYPKKLLSRSMSRHFIPMVSFSNVVASSLAFISLISFKLIFVSGVCETKVSFPFLPVNIQVSHTIYWRDCAFPMCVLGTFVEDDLTIYVWT